MANVVVALIIFTIIGASIYKIVMEKRKGMKCVGCHLSSTCTSHKSTKVASADKIAVQQRIAIKELIE